MEAPVWLIDVDGVVNVTRPGWGTAPLNRRVVVEGEEIRLRWAAELMRQIRAMHEDGTVELRWCTSWCPWADVLEQLWGLLELTRSLDLRHCLLPSAGIDAAKAAAALAVVEGGRRLIWTDDRAVPLAKGLHDRLTAVGQGLLIAPDPRRGLLPEHLDLIEQFAHHPSRRRWPVVLPEREKV